MVKYASREIVHAIRERKVEHTSEQTNKRRENKRHRTRCGEKARRERERWCEAGAEAKGRGCSR